VTWHTYYLPGLMARLSTWVGRQGHLDVAELETRDPNTEARGEVGAAELVRATLRLSPSRLFLGEVLDKSDVSALLNAMSQGNEGSAYTVHARSTGDALGRLVSPCEQAEGLTTSTAGSVIAGALDLVVFISARAGPDGALRRRVRSIREVGAWDGLTARDGVSARRERTGRAARGASR